MKITLERETLASFCGFARGITSAKTSNSFTESIHIVAESGKVQLSATNLEQWMRQISDVTMDRPGRVMVKAEILAQIASLSASDKVEIEAVDTQVIVSSGGDRWKLVSADANDFPKWPTDAVNGKFNMQGADLRAALKKLLPMTASEKGQYALNGIYVEPSDGYIEFVASDGRRLGYIKHPGRGEKPSSQIIIPEGGCDSIIKLVSAGEVTLSFMAGTLSVSTGSIELHTRLVEGQFPDWRSVLPADGELNKTARFEMREIKPALERSKLLVSKESQAVNLDITAGHLSLSSRCPGVGEANVGCVVNYPGELTELAFDPKFVLDAITAGDWEFVEMNFKNNDLPSIFHGGHKDIEFYLVMPIER